MKSIHIEDRPHLEVLSVRASIGRLKRIAALAADGPPSDYWSANELAPEIARILVAATASTLTSRFGLSPGSTRIMYRTRPSRRIDGCFDAEVVLLFVPAREDVSIDLLRRAAAMLLSGLQHPRSRTASNSPHLTSVNTASAEVLLETPFRELLGGKISQDLIAEVPDHPPYTFTNLFAPAPRHSLVEEEIHVRGKISSTKTSGRFRAVGIDGRIEGLAGKEFKQSKVLFSEDLLPAVASAVMEPWRVLAFTVVQSCVPTTRATSRVTYTLKSLRLSTSRGAAQ